MSLEPLALVLYVASIMIIWRVIESRGGTADHPETRWQVFEQLLSSPRLPSGLR